MMFCQAEGGTREEIRLAIQEELQSFQDHGRLATELKQLKQVVEHLQLEVVALQSHRSNVVDNLQADEVQVKLTPASENNLADVNAPSIVAADQKIVRAESYISDQMFNPYLEYTLGGSVWDTSLILGLPEVGGACSFFLGGVFLLNMFIQIFMVYMLLYEESFNNVKAFSQLLDQMTNWRQADGHDYTLENTDGVNLVNRVCNIDESLSIASLQVQTLKQINSYLDLKPLDLNSYGGFAPGPLLCILCILVLTLLVVIEFRKNAYFLLCIGTLPKLKTNLQKDTLVALSLPRFICILILTCVRLGISLCLLYSGMIWLSSTNSMSNLFANAVALAFVLDIDETLFNSIVPHQVATLVGGIRPLGFNAYLYKMDAVLPVSFATAVIVIAYSQHILPNRDLMINIKEVMCGPSRQSLNFVVGLGSAETNIVVSRYSTPFSAAGTHDGRGADLRRALFEIWSDPHMVAESHEWGHLTSRLGRGETVPMESMWVEPNLFSDTLRSNMKDFSSGYNTGCADLDIWWAFENRELVYVQEMIRRMANVREDLSPAAISNSTFFRCSDYAEYCDMGLDSGPALVKMLCPQMCGCDNPRSGLYIGAPGSPSGCPESCDKLRTQRFKALACEDFNPAAAFNILRLQNSTYAVIIDNLLESSAGDDGASDMRSQSLLALDITEAHMLALIGKRLGKEFQSTAEASAYILREQELNPDIENNTFKVVGLSNYLVMTWTRYWKSVGRNVPTRYEEQFRQAFFSCGGALALPGIFDDLEYAWDMCMETSEIAVYGATSIRSFCPATCYALGSQGGLKVDKSEFEFCQ